MRAPARVPYALDVSDSPLAPSLLVAMPQLTDPNFHRSVVALVEHDEEGTFGLVVNRPTSILALELCSGLDIQWRGDSESLVSSGGPCQPDTGWVLIGDVDGFDASRVDDGIYFARSLETLRRVAEHPPEEARIFLGYAGWGPGQLEEELAAGAWLVAPITKGAVFSSDPDTLWEGVIRGLGVDPATLVHTSGVH
ncbi:MAG: YqgE/AlgH family protein [Myxococcota bacterium]